MIEIGNVNYVAVLAAAVAAFIIGFAWYSKMLFGAKWMKLSGISEKKAKGGMGSTIAIAFASMLVWAFVLAHFVKGAAMMDALTIGAVIWLGFAVTKNAGMVLWEGKSTELFIIHAGHDLVATLAACAVLASL